MFDKNCVNNFDFEIQTIKLYFLLIYKLDKFLIKKQKWNLG